MIALRRFLVWLVGVPVCHACAINGLDCVGHCGKTDQERIDLYLFRGCREEGDPP